MRLLRALTLAAVCGLTSSAFADPPDYQTNVLDPVAFATNYTVNVIQSNVFPVVFGPCATAELPSGITAQGCFAGINDTGTTWNGLSIVFPNTAALGSQPASCAPAASDNIFSGTDCALSPDKTAYFLDFSDGTITSYPDTPGDQFFIVENGVPPDSFPPGIVTASAVTPEPASLPLMLTGIALLGTLLYRPSSRPSLLR